MKKIYFILFVLFASTIFAQIDITQIIPDYSSFPDHTNPQEIGMVCKADQSLSPNLIHLDEIRGMDHTNDIYHIKIYIHTLHKKQYPQYGFTTEAINRMLMNLYSDFDPLGIYFVWDGRIDAIYDDDLAFPDTMFGGNINDIFNTHNHSDGIDIYLADELLSGSNWFIPNGIANSTEMLIAGFSQSWEITPISWHKYVSHTMGHILFLYDTHTGTSIHDTNPDHCAEYADGSNSYNCGDYITDTPADPGLYFFNVNPNDCSFDPQFFDIPAIDPYTNLPYAPDTGYIMSLTTPECYSHFTYGQKKRMKNAIWYIPALHNTLLDEWSYIRNDGEDCYVCGLHKFSFYTSNDVNSYNVIENSDNISVSFTPTNNGIASITANSLIPNDVEGSSGYFKIGQSTNDPNPVVQPLWVGLPETVEDAQLTGPDTISSGEGYGYVLENNKWLGGTDHYIWEMPPNNHPVHYYAWEPDDTVWQFLDYAKHFFFITGNSGNQTGLVTVRGRNPCGLGSNGNYNEICVTNTDDPEGDIDCDDNPVIYYYPNPAESLLEVDLSLQDYKVFDIVIYDENQTVKYTGQSTNVVKSIDATGLPNGMYYMHIYDGDEQILNAILYINH